MPCDGGPPTGTRGSRNVSWTSGTPGAGWTGKLAAMHQGFVHVQSLPAQPDFVLFCDADIAFAPPVLSRLVAGATVRGTVLSSHEVSLGYKEVTDPSVYVRFRAVDDAGASFLAWTTTPWTLLSNVGVAVNPEVTYAVVDGFVVAEALVACRTLTPESPRFVRPCCAGRPAQAPPIWQAT